MGRHRYKTVTRPKVRRIPRVAFAHLKLEMQARQVARTRGRRLARCLARSALAGDLLDLEPPDFGDGYLEDEDEEWEEGEAVPSGQVAPGEFGTRWPETLELGETAPSAPGSLHALEEELAGSPVVAPEPGGAYSLADALSWDRAQLWIALPDGSEAVFDAGRDNLRAWWPEFRDKLERAADAVKLEDDQREPLLHLVRITVGLARAQREAFSADAQLAGMLGLKELTEKSLAQDVANAMAGLGENVVGERYHEVIARFASVPVHMEAWERFVPIRYFFWSSDITPQQLWPLVQGGNQRELARSLGKSPSTVRRPLQSLCRRLAALGIPLPERGQKWAARARQRRR